MNTTPIPQRGCGLRSAPRPPRSLAPRLPGPGRALALTLMLLGATAAPTRAQTPFTVVAEDGLRISALHWAPEPGAAPAALPAVVLIHGGGQRKEVWDRYDLVRFAGPERRHVVALDLRNHGESEPSPRGSNPGWAVYDVEAVLAWLRERDDVDPDRIALVGASYGANVSYAGILTRGWQVVGMVALSATMSGFAWFPEEAWDAGRIRHALLVHAEAELDRYRTHEALARLAPRVDGNLFTGEVDGSTHAQGLIVNHPEVGPLVEAWLDARLGR